MIMILVMSTITRGMRVYVAHQVRSFIHQYLINCFKITKNKKDIQKPISEVAHNKGLDDYDLNHKFHQSKIAKETNICKEKVFINKSLKCELNLMISILSYPIQS